MGLFGKSKNDGDFDIELSSYTDVAEADSLSATGGENDDTLGAFNQEKGRSAGQGNPGGYGIQDAIELMRKLPNVNSDIVITVVRKTLESTNIQVKEIISDAQKRETEIEDRSDQLIMEIEKLESKISELNEEITELNAEIEETTKVKDLLLNSMAQEAPEADKVATSATVNTGSNASKNASNSDKAVDTGSGQVLSESGKESSIRKSDDNGLKDAMEDINDMEKLPAT
ncbi:MAG: hypothetical protein GXP08_14015 [Gammaproteobacteria bacterium]|nr:hypothetical protein [Gammaproteobacteria bacterium]